MIVAEYSNYIDPVMSMLYIITLIWTCVPLVRYNVKIYCSSCQVTISPQGLLPHSASDNPWKCGRNSSQAVHSSKVPRDIGLTRGEQCLPRIIRIVNDQVHVWTLTPSDMVLTAHITYQNRHVFSEIHTQVAKLAAFCYHHHHDYDYHHYSHCSRPC